jgi:hypothetical protein
MIRTSEEALSADQATINLGLIGSARYAAVAGRKLSHPPWLLGGSSVPRSKLMRASHCHTQTDETWKRYRVYLCPSL